jgi:hypothetical protein
MFRRLRNLLLLLPVLLFLLVLYLSARSYLPEHLFFRSHQGKLLLVFVTGTEVRLFDPGADQYSGTTELISLVQRRAAARRAPQGRFMGIEWVGMDFLPNRPCMLMIPYWYLATPLALASVWSVLILRRRRIRERPGHCTSCGYDLRASLEKCPECGTPRLETAVHP